MTLRELIRNKPDAFYVQNWYAEEPFMDRDHDIPDIGPPDELTHRGIPPEMIIWDLEELPPAVVLAALYVEEPDHPIWLSRIWTGDFDREGQRVYVSENGHGLEIHRHLHLSDRFGIPSWPEDVE